MKKKWSLAALLALPLVVASVVYGAALRQRQAEQPQLVGTQGYTCPITGEELPCSNCCPLNQQQRQTSAGKLAEKPRKAAAAAYICPVTGEELPCSNCCPLNQQKK